MLLKWKDTYSCNIAEIDNQHKKLFELGSKAFEIASLKDEYDHYDNLIEILEELKAYTIYHFNYEEKLMQENNFDKFESHKIEHDFFIKKVQKIERKDLEGKQNEAVLEIIQFIADWISSHILKSDMEYKTFLNEKGIY
ncbi:bacteriohemerythrin [Petroclostridium xylanilyticum]|jgi:hemerythrin|uniref:bacteriohemerythrin n=1 Tax=Petroclostridium xylanilyticum TaxID=1792311 RepID=UPI000B98A5D5|nr:bacteriohemerythrin [Petroclostridium xylanilyticum]